MMLAKGQGRLSQRAGRQGTASGIVVRVNVPVSSLRTASRSAWSSPAPRPALTNRSRVSTNAATAAPTLALGSLSIKGALKPDNSNIVVLGSQGAAGAKLTKALLEAGFKVTAGVDFPEQAKATVAFAKRYELLSKTQLANLKLAESDDALPARSKVVILEGDVLGDKKVDDRFVRAALQRAEDAGAAQVVLVSLNSSGGGGGLFSFGSSPKTPNRSLTRTEQLLSGSSFPVTVVRASLSDEADEESGARVVAGPGSLAPATAPVSQDLLTEVLGAVLTQPSGPAGAPLVVEVGSVPAGQAGPVADAVFQAVQEAKDRAPAARAASPVRERSPSPLPSLPLGLGTIGVKKASAAELDDAPKPKATQRVAVRPAAKTPARDEEDEEEEAAKPRNFFASLLGGTGTQRVSVKKSPTPAPAKAGTQGVRVGTASVKPGTTSVRAGTTSVKAAPAAPAARKPNPFSSIKRVASEEPAKPAPKAPVKAAIPAKPAAPAPAAKPKSGGNLFGFFAINPTSAVDAEDDAPAKPAPKAVARATPSKPAPAPPARGRAASPTAEKAVVAKPTSGFKLASLFGLGSSRDADDEDEAPARPAARKAAPPPPPKPVAKVAAKPAPAPVRSGTTKTGTTSSSAATSAPARSSNPFSSVKRVAAPPAPAAPAKPAPKTGTTTSKVPAKPTPAPSSGTVRGTSIKGTYRPVSGYSVEPKKK